MRTRLQLAALLAAGLFLACGGPRACAEAGPYVTPGSYGASLHGYDPYFNLLRGGNLTADYYLGPLPEVERGANALLFGTQIQEHERRLQGTDEMSAPGNVNR